VAIGYNPIERHGRTAIPARTLHAVRAAMVRGWLVADVHLENIAGDDALYDLYGWPLPGRQITVSLRTGGLHAP
jgi:hypothetical protein